ncbi:hypothetical protein C2R22_02250 [Salinigranum rubrum]|uniref:Uncharacterized protein n=1 Tax=Salinigranum rubrum TaxID=755307 RepID=A0A2I8VFI1_9EURY|nr:hypothetical protein [Salinigranum rubrum]AUV80624.1 hypothetical protein C2R22_02250 [Salinigranum rubrum]
MTADRNVSSAGDLTLAGSEAPPVSVTETEDVFLRSDGVAGDVHVTDAEYVFTHQSLGQSEEPPDPRTRIAGDEDAYVEPGGVDGDLTLANVADVFVPREAAAGTLSVLGSENVYSAPDPEIGLDACDVVSHGWQQRAEGSDPDTGVYVTGAGHAVTVDRVREDVDVYVVGWGHEVELDGRGSDVSVHFCGYDNTVRLGPYLSGSVESDAGFDNAVDEEPFPVEDLVEQSKREACKTAGFGRHKVIYQEPASEEWCGNCGEPADAVVERHQMEAFFLFSYPVWVYERSTNPAMECEHCSPNAHDASLTADERRDVLQ